MKVMFSIVTVIFFALVIAYLNLLMQDCIWLSGLYYQLYIEGNWKNEEKTRSRFAGYCLDGAARFLF